jgi:hypothetical protein
MEGIFRHTLGPSGGHTRPIRQWHIQHFIGPTTSNPTIVSPYGPGPVGKQCEGNAILSLRIRAQRSQIDLPVLHS